MVSEPVLVCLPSVWSVCLSILAFLGPMRSAALGPPEQYSTSLPFYTSVWSQRVFALYYMYVSIWQFQISFVFSSVCQLVGCLLFVRYVL